MVGGSHHFRIAVVDFELRRSDLGVVFFVLEAHGALHFGGGVNKGAQRIAGQRMVVAAGIDVLELASFVIAALGVRSLEQETFNLVGRVERVALLLVQHLGVALQHATNVGCIRRPTLVDDFAEYQHFAGTENIRRAPIESGPVDAQPQIALALRRKAANRRAVEGEIVPTLDQKLLVVIQHVQPALEIAKEHGHSLDPLLVGQILQPLFLDLVDRDTLTALFLRLQIQFFQFVVGECQEIAQFIRHGWSSVSYS